MCLSSIVRDQGVLSGTTLDASARFPQILQDFRGDSNRSSGADRSRTGDLRLAKPALSQLSYGPSNTSQGSRSLLRKAFGQQPERVGQGRVDLPTSRLSGERSNHLSYWPSETRRP